jgi:hypothetical protein
LPAHEVRVYVRLMSTPYKPVDTDLVDDLEHFAVDKIHVRIVYLDHTSTREELRGHIAEVFTKDHQEFLRMTDKREMRLDQILEVHTDRPHYVRKL